LAKSNFLDCQNTVLTFFFWAVKPKYFKIDEILVFATYYALICPDMYQKSIQWLNFI